MDLHTHPRARGKLYKSLELLKRPEGLTQLEATFAGAGTRLAAQIQRLESRGNVFRWKWEKAADGTKHKRYWWVRWQPLVETAK